MQKEIKKEGEGKPEVNKVGSTYNGMVLNQSIILPQPEEQVRGKITFNPDGSFDVELF